MLNRYRAILILFCLFISCNPSNKSDWSTTNNEIVKFSGKPAAFMWLAPDCPLCQVYSSEYIKLAKQYSQELTFYGVLPGGHYLSKEIQHFQDSFEFNLPIIVDDNFELTKKYGVTVTPEFVMIDSIGEILYQGKFDDWATGLGQKKTMPSKFYFNNALQSMAERKTIEPNYVEPVGCFIEMD